MSIVNKKKMSKKVSQLNPKENFITYLDSIIIFSITLSSILGWEKLIDLEHSVLKMLIFPSLVLLSWHRAYQIYYDIKMITLRAHPFDKKTLTPIDTDKKKITFIIASFQEPFEVAKMTFDSIIKMEWKGEKEIIVVDNSKDIISQDFISWKNYVNDHNTNKSIHKLTTKFAHNTETNKLKPGNLDKAQWLASGQYVLILDVDSTLPVKSTLLQDAIAQMDSDSRLGFVQFKIEASNSHFNNFTAVVAKTQNLLRLRMTFRGYGGHKVFEGHNGIWKKEVLDEIGTWTEYFDGNIIITEDILMSLKMYERGFYGKSMSVATGEWVPSSIASLEAMWMRWMYGNSQVLFKHSKKIYCTKTTVLEKLDISFHILHHFATLSFLSIFIMLQVISPGHDANIFFFAFGIIPQLIAAITSCTFDEHPPKSFIGKVKLLYQSFFLVDTFIMFVQIRSDFNFISRIPHGWKVTNKGIEKKEGLTKIIRNYSFYLICILSISTILASIWALRDNFKPQSLMTYSSSIFIAMNLMLSLLLYYKDGRDARNPASTATIDELRNCI